jgi:hypothetical protein
VIRSQIPDAMLAARRADIDRIPAPALAKMTRTDLAERLVAAGNFRSRARQRHQPAETARMYSGFASEVLATTDLKRAAALVKAAGVGAPGPSRPAVPAPRAGASPVAKAAAGQTTITYPALDLLTEKATAARSVATAIIELAKAGRLGDLERDISALRRDFGSGRMELVKGPPGLAKGAGAAPPPKAAEYERLAGVAVDPETRRGYLELARRERERAGAL